MTRDEQHDNRPANGPAHPRRKGWMRHTPWVATAIIIALVAMQWPIYRSMAMELLNIDPPDDNIAWRTDFEAAMAEAEASGKPLLVNFTADWCGPCVAMKRDVWPRGSVGDAVSSGYIPVRLDVDEPEGQRMGMHYGVSAIPTTIVATAEGEELERVNYLSRRAMEEFLAEWHTDAQAEAEGEATGAGGSRS